MRFKDRLTAMRQDKCMTIAELSRATGIRAYTLIQFEDGLLPTTPELQALSKALGVLMIDLILAGGRDSARDELLELYDSAPVDVKAGILESARFLRGEKA